MFFDPFSRLKKASLGFAAGVAVGTIGGVVVVNYVFEDLNPIQKYQVAGAISTMGGLTGLAIDSILKVIPPEQRHSPNFLRILLDDLYSFLREEAYDYINVGVGQPILLVRKMLDFQQERTVAESIKERYFNQYRQIVLNQETPSPPQPPALGETTEPEVQIPFDRTVERVKTEEELPEE